MFLFNPDNDLALANFSFNYTAPASARKLASDLAVLPVWYVPSNSVVIADTQVNNSYYSQVKQLLPLSATLIDYEDVAAHPAASISPWGWNPALKTKLLRLGVKENLLPSDADLWRLKDYSNRKHAVSLLKTLKETNSAFCGESHYFTHLEDVLLYLGSFSGDKALKMPVSGSGKGLIWIKGEITDKQIDWCRRVIRDQGGVVAEPMLNKTIDFAMEFYLHNGDISFVGYSLFHAAASGAYTGNELMSDSAIEKHISSYVSVKNIQSLQNLLLDNLVRYFPSYNGYLGVDMMVCQTKHGYKLQPCVEINIRMNMGLVAHFFYKKYVCEGSIGTYKVDYFKNEGEAYQHHKEMSNIEPLVIEKNKIKSGYFSLTPVCATTNYVAWVLIKQQ